MTATRRPTQRLIATALAVVALVSLVGASCSGDDEDAKDTTSTTAEAGSGEDATEEGGDTTEGGTEEEAVSDDDFNAAVDPLAEDIQGASDACDLISVLTNSGNLPTPTNPAQVEVAVNFIADMLEKMGALNADAAASAQYTEAAEAWRQAGEEAGYDPEKLDLAGEGPDLGGIDYFTLLNTWYEDNSTDCPDAIPTEPEAPVEAPTSAP